MAHSVGLGGGAVWTVAQCGRWRSADGGAVSRIKGTREGWGLDGALCTAPSTLS